MKMLFVLAVFVVGTSACTNGQQTDVSAYHARINEAELALCEQEYQAAILAYEAAFQLLPKPFGKDVMNAALVCGLQSDRAGLQAHLQTIINNTEDLTYVAQVFVPDYLSAAEWAKLLAQRAPAYDADLLAEMKAINARDQLFRPLYETHDDTINANRLINLGRIQELTASQGYPSHFELGYRRRLIGQGHDIVLHHTAQRRSRDKSVLDLEPLLREAVEAGRFDPEFALVYLNYQQDPQKGSYDTYSSWQFTHAGLPDSLSQRVWYPKWEAAQIEANNAVRRSWHANSIEDIQSKTEFLQHTEIPFRFSSVRKSVAKLASDLDPQSALDQYQAFTMSMQ